jgi:hypothetical protein
MKKIFFIGLTIFFTSGAIALPTSPSDKIMDMFHQDFPAVHEQIIKDCKDYFVVYFKDTDVSSCRVFYTPKGKMIGTIKYYDASKLDPFIHRIINEKYKGKEIKGITEMSSNDVHSYEIILQDKKGGCKVKYDGSGRLTMVQKWTTLS